MAKHVQITKRDVGVCDFCSGPDIRFRYPCSATITMVAVDGDGEARMGATSNDDWAGCAGCAPVIALKDPARLAAHVIDTGHAADPATQVLLSLVPEFRQIAMGNLVELYTNLLPALGEPVPDDGVLTGDAGQVVHIMEDDDDS